VFSSRNRRKIRYGYVKRALVDSRGHAGGRISTALQNAANLSHVKGPIARFFTRRRGIYFPVSHATYFISSRDILICIPDARQSGYLGNALAAKYPRFRALAKAPRRFNSRWKILTP
jgi:hypothetical protein